MKDLLIYIFSDYKIFLGVLLICMFLSKFRLFEINHYYINKEEQKELKEINNIWNLIIDYFNKKK